MWLADDYLRITGDLEGFRKIVRLRRRFIWCCGFWNRFSFKSVHNILKRVYAPAITDLFSRQSMIYTMFKEKHDNEQAGIRVPKSEGGDANRDLAAHE